MERRLRKNEQTEKKFNVKLTKDQGDNTRKITVEKHATNVLLADRGDSNRKTNQITDKVKLNVSVNRNIVDPSKSRNVDRIPTHMNAAVSAVKDAALKKPTDKITATHQKTPVDPGELRKLRDKYNDKSNNAIVSSTLVKKEENVKFENTVNRAIKNLSNAETTNRKEKINELPNESGKSDTKSNKKESSVQRKTIIKTVTSKNDGRIYKTVSFVEQKHQLPTPLQINIPNYAPKKNKSKTNVLTSIIKPKIPPENKAVVKKPVSIRNKYNKKIIRTRKKTESISPDRRAISPATEVAKWAPSCVNQHTKPYYEAWVNTTLAAISKKSKKDKLFFEDENIIKTFKRALEKSHRPLSPDLIYDKINDERYIGRIKVRHKDMKIRTHIPSKCKNIDVSL